MTRWRQTDTWRGNPNTFVPLLRKIITTVGVTQSHVVGQDARGAGRSGEAAQNITAKRTPGVFSLRLLLAGPRRGEGAGRPHPHHPELTIVNPALVASLPPSRPRALHAGTAARRNPGQLAVRHVDDSEASARLHLPGQGMGAEGSDEGGSGVADIWKLGVRHCSRTSGDSGLEHTPPKGPAQARAQWSPPVLVSERCWDTLPQALWFKPTLSPPTALEVRRPK